MSNKQLATMSPMIQAQHTFLQQVARLIVKADDLGLVVTAGEMWRPQEMQDIYLKTGRSKVKTSQHIKRLAIDLNVFVDGKLATRDQIAPLGRYWESLDPKNRWGGNWTSFVDAPHFERQG